MKINRLLAFAVGTAMIISMSPAVVFADEAESSEPAETTVVESSEPSEKETPKASETEPAQTEDTSPVESKDEEPTEDSAGKETSVSEEKSTLPVKTVKKAKNAAVFVSGTCGKKVKWSLDEDGTLTVSGTGNMYNYDLSNNRVPWKDYKNDIKAVVIISGVTSISDYAFWGYEGIQSLEIADGVKTIGMCSFTRCLGLKSVTIPGSVEKIGGAAFNGCKNITNIKIGYGVKIISDSVFAYTAIDSVSIPASVKELGMFVFGDCENLKDISLEYGIEKIGHSAFQGTDIERLTIPSSVTSMGSGIIAGCSKLKDIKITKELYDKYYNSMGKNPADFTPDFYIANPMTVKGKTAKVKYKKLRKKAKTLSASKVIKITKRGQGSLLYAKVKGNKKITINRTTGKVTVKKKIKKGTYKVKVKVIATGNDTYRDSGWKTVTFKIKVK